MTSITFSYDEKGKKHPQLEEITARNKELSELKEHQNESDQIVKKVHLNNDQEKVQVIFQQAQEAENDLKHFENEEVTNSGEILDNFQDQ